jgi:hypothetical protein
MYFYSSKTSKFSSQSLIFFKKDLEKKHTNKQQKKNQTNKPKKKKKPEKIKTLCICISLIHTNIL